MHGPCRCAWDIRLAFRMQAVPASRRFDDVLERTGNNDTEVGGGGDGRGPGWRGGDDGRRKGGAGLHPSTQLLRPRPHTRATPASPPQAGRAAPRIELGDALGAGNSVGGGTWADGGTRAARSDRVVSVPQYEVAQRPVA